MLEKSLALDVDSVIYDLEDSVLPEAKSAARSLVANHVSALNLQPNPGPLPEVAVRINAISTGLALDDISEVRFLKTPLHILILIWRRLAGPRW